MSNTSEIVICDPGATEVPAVVQPTANPPVETRHTLFTDWAEVVQELWQFRELVYQFTLRDIRVRYKQAIFGFAWAILMPMLIVLAGIVVKYAMATSAGKPLELEGLAGMAIKGVFWSFFVGAINSCTLSMQGQRSLITKIYFPREVFPVSSLTAQAFDSAIGILALLVVLPFMGVAFGVQSLWALPLIVILITLTLSIGMLTSMGNLFFRDVKYIVQVFVTFGIFFTPVLFDAELFGPIGVKVVMINPVAPVLEGFRLAVTEGHNLLSTLSVVGASGETILVWSPWYLFYSAIFGVISILIASVTFHRLEFLFAEYA